jgi:hypothetical protein
MISKLVTWAGKKALNRWILGGAAALVLGSAGLMWHNHKQGLRDEGRHECIQAINEQTVIDLENALAEEKKTSAELAEYIRRVAAANAEAEARHRDAQARVDVLLEEIQEQKKNDKTYSEWSDTSLPNGVSERLRSTGTRSDTRPGNEDSN